MASIFRFRPSNDLTIEELRDSYLWFSRPTGFKDKKDANLIAFAEANESLKDAFNRVFYDYNVLGQGMNFAGICCFTNTLPNFDDWKRFPNSANGGIIIEYDKCKLKNYFLTNYCVPFNKVKYLPDPLKLVSSTPDGYDVLWEIIEDGENRCMRYKSIRDIIRDSKTLDQLILKLLTSIDEKHHKQDESRIILPLRFIPDKSPNLTGYKISIPADVIAKIHVHPKTCKAFKEELRSVIPLNKLNFHSE